jgi:hypothetical protein
LLRDTIDWARKGERTMPDPITAGSLVAAALAAGAAEAGKAALGPAARDAYAALRSSAARVLGPAVGWLEKKPESDDLAAGVAEEVANQPDAVRTELAALAEALKAALAAEGRAGTIDNRVTVIATHGGIAAGHTVNVTLPGKS